MSWIRSTLFSYMRQPLQTVIRNKQNKTPLYYSEKKANGPLVRRYGYRDDFFHEGLLPRTTSGKKLPMPDYRPSDAWNEKRALFGQNDYIDILGPDNTIHPTRILYNVPQWLRGVKGNEFQICIRRRKMWTDTTFPKRYPSKWNLLRKRIQYLYKYLNQKTKTYYTMRSKQN